MKNPQKGFALPVVIIAVVLLGAGGGIYYHQKTKSKPQPPREVIVAHNENSQIEGEASLESSIGAMAGVTTKSKDSKTAASAPSGKNIICTGTSSPYAGATAHTTVYADGVMNRQDVATIYKGTISTHSSIMKENYFYSWQGTMGIKQRISVAGVNITNSTRASNEALGYSCRSWVRDGSKFLPPKTVVFEDLGSSNLPAISPDMMEMMKKTQGANYQPNASDFETLDVFFHSQAEL